MEFGQAIERLKSMAAVGAAGRYLLSLLPRELTVQRLPTPQAAANRPDRYVRRQFGRNAKAGQTLAELLAHFERHPGSQTVNELAAATRLNYGTLFRVLKKSGRFERDKLNPLRWRPKSLIRKEEVHAGT